MKSEVHLDTMQALRTTGKFARRDRVFPNSPAGVYFPKDGIFYYLPVLVGANETHLVFHRMLSLTVSSLGAAFTCEALVILFGFITPGLIALAVYATSPLFAFFSQNLMAEPYQLFGVGSLLLGIALACVRGQALIKNERQEDACFNFLWLSGAVVLVLSKFDGIVYLVACCLADRSWLKVKRKRQTLIGIFLIWATVWSLLWFITRATDNSFEIIDDFKAVISTYQNHTGLSYFLLPLWFLLTDGSVSILLSIFLCLGLLRKRTLPIVLPLGTAFLLRWIIQMGFSSGHNYYQFSFLPLLAIGAGGLASFAVFRSKYVVPLSAVGLVTCSVLFQVIVIQPLYTIWRGAIEIEPPARALMEFISSNPGKTCLGVIDNTRFCRGATYYGADNAPHVCRSNPDFYDYFIFNRIHMTDYSVGDVPALYENEKYIVYPYADWCLSRLGKSASVAAQ